MRVANDEKESDKNKRKKDIEKEGRRREKCIADKYRGEEIQLTTQASKS